MSTHSERSRNTKYFRLWPLVVELGRRKHNANDEGEDRGVACEGITILVLDEHRNAEGYYQNTDPHLPEIEKGPFVYCQAARAPGGRMYETTFLIFHGYFMRRDGGRLARL